MGSESGQSPLRIVPQPVAIRVVSSIQRFGLNFKPSSLSERRKSEHFFGDNPQSSSSIGVSSTKKSPSIPMSSQLENLNVGKTSNDYKKYISGDCERVKNGDVSKQFHEKSPSWPVAKCINDNRRQSSFNDQMQDFSSSVNEKLLHKKHRPDRGSFCKSTISSHDSGIGMQEDVSLSATPVTTPTVGCVTEGILRSRLVMNNYETGNDSINKSFDPNTESDVWFGTSTPLLKRKSMGVINTRYDDIPLIDENPALISLAHKNQTSPMYDSETLRKSAQKNREIAAKLLPKLQQRTSPRELKNTPFRYHERQSSLDRGCVNEQSPYSNRFVIKSPSQLSCSGSSSIYTESSNGTMSSNGGENCCTNDLMFTSLRDNLKTYHEEQRDLIWRSASIDTLGSEFNGANVKSMTNYLSSFNQPQQRSNIVSMLSIVDDKQENVSPKIKYAKNVTGIKAIDNGNFKEKLLARSMPNLNEMPIVEDDDDEAISPNNCSIEIRTFLSNASDPLVQDENLKQPIFKGSYCSKRSDSPIYAVPDRNFNFRGSLNSMKNPPPLPKKPPPSFSMEQKIRNRRDDLPDCVNEIIVTSKTSSVSSTSASVDDLQRCAVNGVVHRGIKMPHCDNSKHLLNHQQRCPNTNQQCYQNGIHESQSPRGRNTPVFKRPIVPVHPYNEQDLVVGTTYQINGFNNEKSSSAKPLSLSPRPPVPPKPEKIVSSSKPPPQLPPKPTANVQHTVQTQETASTLKNLGTKCVEPQIRLRTVEIEDMDMSRRSRIVAENSNDADLIDILVGQQRQSVDYISIVFDRSRPQPQPSSYLSGAGKSDQNYHKNETKVDDGRKDSCKNIIPSPLTRTTDQKDVSFCSTSDNPLDLEKEKKNLITSLASKLSVLKKTLREVEQEIDFNDSLGQSIHSIIETTSNASSHDKESFRLHVEDTEKVTRLLLKLSAQLARVENDLNRLPATSSTKEKQSYTERRQRLMMQLQDAKCLKEDLDRRGDDVLIILRHIFDDDQMADYKYFIQMKSQLLIDAREIEDKIKLGEDQKNALEDSLKKACPSE